MSMVVGFLRIRKKGGLHKRLLHNRARMSQTGNPEKRMIATFPQYTLLNGPGSPAGRIAPAQVVEATLFRVGVMSLCPMKCLYRPIEIT
jgi:hypothetical protein